MTFGTILPAVVLLVAGAAFALFLGIMSERIERERHEQAGHSGDAGHAG